MKLSKEQQTRLRKLVPLVVLYPLSTGVGVVSTLYVAKAINHSYPASNVSENTSISSRAPAPATTTTESPTKQLEQQQIVRLQTQIALLKNEIQQLTGQVGSQVPQNISPNLTRPQTTQAPHLTRAKAPAPAPAPPPTHGSTGASRALR